MADYDFPKRLHDTREDADMNQSQLAERMGVSSSAISWYELGRRDINTRQLYKLCYEIFNVSADYLLGRNDRMIVDITELNEKERRLVLTLVQTLRENKQ